MQYDGLAVGVALLALLALLVAARILWRSDWLLGWLRGSAGLLLLALAGLIALVANDVRSYQPLPEGKPLVTLSFQALGPQRYQVSLLQGAEERLITLEGDLWQLVYDAVAQQFCADRSASGWVDFHPAFGACHVAPRIGRAAQCKVSLYADAASMETIADGGLTALTSVLFPRAPWTQLVAQGAVQLSMHTPLNA